MSQAIIIFPATGYFILRRFWRKVPPSTEEPITWVVLTGIPTMLWSPTIIPAPVSATKPCFGSSLANFHPKVFITFHPIKNVPIPIANPQAIFTHKGTTKLLINPPESRAAVIMPIAFWVSFIPWVKDTKEAEII